MYKNSVRVLHLAMINDINGISKCCIDSIALTPFINKQIKLKKLKFHVPDKKGWSKCYKMHVGIQSRTCSNGKNKKKHKK